MRKKLVWFIKNDVVFWIFFTSLCVIVASYILKKEDIKITITFGEQYNNKVIQITGD